MDPTSRDALEAASEELAKEEAEKIAAVLARVTGGARLSPVMPPEGWTVICDL